MTDKISTHKIISAILVAVGSLCATLGLGHWVMGSEALWKISATNEFVSGITVLVLGIIWYYVAKVAGQMEPEEEEVEEEVPGEEEGEEEIDYQELSEQSVSDIKEKDDEMEMDYEKLLEVEKANKNRKTLVEWLENKIEGT